MNWYVFEDVVDGFYIMSEEDFTETGVPLECIDYLCSCKSKEQAQRAMEAFVCLAKQELEKAMQVVNEVEQACKEDIENNG